MTHREDQREKVQLPQPAQDMRLSGSYCLFQESWWLDLATDGDWDEVKVENNGETAARLPFQLKRRYGFKVLTQPPFTPYLGPWFHPTSGKETKQRSDQYTLTSELLSRLPRYDLFHQTLWPELTNWLPFYWSGFGQTTGYTYWVRDILDDQAVWKRLTAGARGAIRKAERTITIATSNDVNRLCDIYDRTFSQQGKRVPYKREILARIAEGAVRAGHGRITQAEDKEGNVHAAILIVFDRRMAHYLVGGADSRFRASGAASLLIWDAIRFAGRHSMTFDFEGSMVPGIERFFRSFNPTLVSCNRVFKTGKVFGSLIHLRNAAAALMGKPPLRI